MSDTEEPEVKEESDDSFDEGEIVGTVEQVRYHSETDKEGIW